MIIRRRTFTPPMPATSQIDIETLEIIDGWLSPRALRLVAEWGGEHRDELRENWDRARAHQRLSAIDPLP